MRIFFLFFFQRGISHETIKLTRQKHSNKGNYLNKKKKNLYDREKNAKAKKGEVKAKEIKNR